MATNADNLANEIQERLWQLATAVRDDYFSAAVTAYENASMDGWSVSR